MRTLEPIVRVTRELLAGTVREELTLRDIVRRPVGASYQPFASDLVDPAAWLPGRRP